MNTEMYIRLKLIMAFNGDVVKAETALDFIHGKPEASERYKRFKQWEAAEYKNYCESKGIKLGSREPPS